MDAAHIHLLFTHVPIIGIVLGTEILAYGIFSRKLEATRVSLGVFVLSGIAAIVVYLTGEPAEEIVEGLAGVSEAAIEEHEEFAVIALVFAVVLGVIALADLMISRKRLPPWLTSATLVLALISSGVMAWTANLGGKINHPELQSGAAGSQEDSRSMESGEEEDDD